MIFKRGEEGESVIGNLARLVFELNGSINEIDDHTNIFDSHILDSLDFASLIFGVEELREAPIPVGAVVPESFSSLTAIESAFFIRV